MNRFTSEMKKVMPGHNKDANTAADKGPPVRNRLNLDMLRNQTQPELSKKLHMLIKSEGHVIDSYETAGRELSSYATQMGEWGLGTEDDAITEITEGLKMLLAEAAETEDNFASQLEESRTLLKAVRNIEKDTAKTRQERDKYAVELEKQRQKEPENPKVDELERALARAQAATLVAESQLTTVTRKQLKAAYDVHLAAMIERGEKQNILARHMRSLVLLLDDTPVKPDETRAPFTESDRTQEIVVDAKRDLSAWEPTHEEIPSNSEVTTGDAMTAATSHQVQNPSSATVSRPPVEPVGPAPPPGRTEPKGEYREPETTYSERAGEHIEPELSYAEPKGEYREPMLDTTQAPLTTTERLQMANEAAPAYSEHGQSYDEPVPATTTERMPPIIERVPERVPVPTREEPATMEPEQESAQPTRVVIVE